MRRVRVPFFLMLALRLAAAEMDAFIDEEPPLPPLPRLNRRGPNPDPPPRQPPPVDGVYSARVHRVRERRHYTKASLARIGKGVKRK